MFEGQADSCVSLTCCYYVSGNFAHVDIIVNVTCQYSRGPREVIGLGMQCSLKSKLFENVIITSTKLDDLGLIF